MNKVDFALDKLKWHKTKLNQTKSNNQLSN